MRNLRLHIPWTLDQDEKQRIERIIQSLKGVVLNKIEDQELILTLMDEGRESEILLAIQKNGFDGEIIPITYEQNHPLNQMRFTTNIKCAGCIEKVKPVLDELVDEAHWEVDLTSTQKILTVHSNSLSEGEIRKALATVGYQASLI